MLTNNHAKFNHFICLFMLHKYNYSKPKSEHYDKTAGISISHPENLKLS